MKRDDNFCGFGGGEAKAAARKQCNHLLEASLERGCGQTFVKIKAKQVQSRQSGEGAIQKRENERKKNVVHFQLDCARQCRPNKHRAGVLRAVQLLKVEQQQQLKVSLMVGARFVCKFAGLNVRKSPLCYCHNWHYSGSKGDQPNNYQNTARLNSQCNSRRITHTRCLRYLATTCLMVSWWSSS